ncbi:hypothetical protein ACFQZZ_04935 [Nocardia sp. GCM10030253]|uniref:hypothetical protein n=1 Tax=Nocardia sp. GCM10030253 TaxID=3273404 RepID=UPI0036294752
MSDTHTHDAAPDAMATLGTHGMLVFGTGDDVYFSHLPMFMAPHNAQVLLDVELDERGAAALHADRQAGVAGIHTFDPMEFPLAELDPRTGPVRTTIRGTLVRGHFERGGTPIADEVLATIRMVLYFADLDPNEQHGGEPLTYLCFGRPGRLYLAHAINGRPSFDHIVAARLVPGSATNMAGKPLPDDLSQRGFEHAQPVELGQREFTGARLAVGETVHGSFFATASLGGAHGFAVAVEVTEEIYLEVDELT